MEQDSRAHKLKELFLSCLYISAFTFGGGFVIVTFMKRKFCDQLHWIREEEILDITAMAQSCPGPIAVNAAILVGWQVCGGAGMALAVLGTIIPPVTLLYIISYFYTAFASNLYIALFLKCMQAGVAAVIGDVVLSMGWKVIKGRDPLSLLLMVGALGITLFTDLNVVLLILAAALIGLVKALWMGQKEKEGKAK